MNRIFKALLATAAMTLTAAPTLAQAATIDGEWSTGPRDYRYELSLCGPRGEDLCGVMTYGLDQSPQVQRYVGKRIIDGAKRVGPNSWKGSLIFAGHRMSGTMTMVEPNRLEIDACAMLIICGKFNMYREGTDVQR